jgi:hypothetical protein
MVVRHVVFIFCLGILAGCSGESGHTIEGKVTFADGRPLGQGFVVLSDGAHSYNGMIGSDGKYTAQNVLSGEYNVGFGGVTMGSGSEPLPGAVEGMAYDAQGNYIEGPPPKPLVYLIEKSLCNPDTSGLKVKVPSDAYDITVENPS